MRATLTIMALTCALFLAPATIYAQGQADIFEHSETRAPVSPEFTADFQPGVEELFLLTAADEPKGTEVKRKLLNNLKALVGKGDPTEDTGTQPDTDLTARRVHFSKQGWKGYMDFVREGQLFLKRVARQYEMGSGLIIMQGALDEKSPRYWLGPEDKDSIIFTAKGSFTCRAMDTLMCDNKFRVYIAYGPQDAEGFGDVVIRGWLVEFLNDKGRPIKRD